MPNHEHTVKIRESNGQESKIHRGNSLAEQITENQIKNECTITPEQSPVHGRVIARVLVPVRRRGRINARVMRVEAHMMALRIVPVGLIRLVRLGCIRVAIGRGISVRAIIMRSRHRRRHSVVSDRVRLAVGQFNV